MKKLGPCYQEVIEDQARCVHLITPRCTYYYCPKYHLYALACTASPAKLNVSAKSLKQTDQQKNKGKVEKMQN